MAGPDTLFHDARGVAGDETIRWNVLHHHASRRHHAMVANLDASHDDAVCADITLFSNPRICVNAARGIVGQNDGAEVDRRPFTDMDASRVAFVQSGGKRNRASEGRCPFPKHERNRADATRRRRAGARDGRPPGGRWSAGRKNSRSNSINKRAPNPAFRSAFADRPVRFAPTLLRESCPYGQPNACSGFNRTTRELLTVRAFGSSYSTVLRPRAGDALVAPGERVL